MTTLDFATQKLREVIKDITEEEKAKEHSRPVYSDKELFLQLEPRVRREFNFRMYGRSTAQYIDPVEAEKQELEWWADKRKNT